MVEFNVFFYLMTLGEFLFLFINEEHKEQQGCHWKKEGKRGDICMYLFPGHICLSRKKKNIHAGD